MLIPVRDVGQHGVIRDLEPVKLPINAWSDGQNVKMRNNEVERAPGHEELFASPTVKPYWVLPVASATNLRWLYASTAKLFVADSAGHTDITRAAGDYTGAVNDKWSGGNFGAFAVVSNGVDVPQEWDKDPGNKAVALTAWPAAERCKVLRPFLNFLVAADISVSGVRNIYRVKWSDAAETGSIPGSWTAAATNLAGAKLLQETPGGIVDMWPLSFENYIYKEDAIWRQRFIGIPSVFAWEPLTRALGVFAKECVRNIKNDTRSVVFGLGDVVVHDGRTIESVVDKRWRKWIFGNIDPVQYHRCFIVSFEERNEVWLCLPQSGATWCNIAVIWNWKDNSFGIRELPELSHARGDLLDPGAAGLEWDSATGTWDSYTREWDFRSFNPTQRGIVAAAPDRTQLFQMDTSALFDGSTFTSRLERMGLSYVLDRFGSPVQETRQHKLVKEIHPRFSGSGVVNIFAGGQDVPDGPVSWQGPFPFNINVDQTVRPFTTHRIPAVRFEAADAGEWRMQGYDVVQDVVGEDW